MRRRILDQPIDVISFHEAAYRARMALLNSKQLKIITLNPEMIAIATKNLEFQSAINNANLIIPDGTGIVWALKLLNSNTLEEAQRIPGIELAEDILESANKLKKKVAIYGGTKEVLEKSKTILQQRYKNIQIIKSIDGFQEKENDIKIAKEIAELTPDVVLVGTGTPRQEIWINKYSHLFPKSVMIGIGGSMDVWSGNKPRAPKKIRDMHLEWLFRMVTQPKRTKRILKSIPYFIYMVLREKFRKSDFHTK